MAEGITSIPLAERNFKDLNPCELGWESCVPKHSFGPTIRNHYLIHYVVSGKGTFCLSGVTYHVQAGEIFVICPGEVHSYTADEKEPWAYIWMGFTGQAAERLQNLLSPVCKYPASTFFDVRRAAELSATREEFVTAKIFEMMSVLFENCKQETPYDQQVVNFVNTNYMNPITVDSIAQMLNLDRRYLSRMLKKRMGLTVSEYLIQTRLKHAAALLTAGYSVNQSASMVGYNDPFNFSKMFKKQYGVSPAQYKKQHRE